jgi:hypothetical protein
MESGEERLQNHEERTTKRVARKPNNGPTITLNTASNARDPSERRPKDIHELAESR